MIAWPSLVNTLLFSAICSATYALTCYSTDEEGYPIAVTNSSWKLCGLIPANGDRPASMFGLDPSIEDMEQYLPFFAPADDAASASYSTLSVCVFERYVMRYRHMQSAEHIFRCLCNYDNCNQHATFGAYLKGLKSDNP